MTPGLLPRKERMKSLLMWASLFGICGFGWIVYDDISTRRKQANCLHGALIAVHAMERSTMDLTFNPDAVYVEIDNGCRQYAGLKPR